MRRVIALAVAAFAVVSCFPQGECESAFHDYCSAGDSTCQGHIIAPNQWQSGPIDAAWLPFGAEETILMHLRDAATGATLSGKLMEPYEAISALQVQDAGGPFPGGSAGNLGEFEPGPDSSSIYMRNDTCSNEFVYVVITLDPNTAIITPAATNDAGAD